ncbi:hypothetical protein P1J78_05970 [Psychromarinibacter sp. C21-152]|uniref:Uncharacterized protein n=1 Tax=Psychromarinibacter sediminicola TaxID=3033385 RepID=A0AAE3NRE1_9RHOB|nr:hypothetical protein [Psychromarinibacter sediminicola]MDF0600269.1 hypothetical protein [Psychromarinibacter sediminicola]
MAGALLGAAAVLQLVALVLGADGAGWMLGLGAAVLAALAAAGLWRGWRWLAWPVLPGVIVAAGLALGGIGTPGAPDALRLAMGLVDAAVAICLFAALWRPRHAVVS